MQQRAHNFIVDASSEQPEARPALASWYTPGLSDGLGDRLLMFDNTTSSSLELLRFKREFADQPEFERALRDRVRALDSFRHASVGKVRAVEWLTEDDSLALISNHTVGRRLSEVIHDARGQQFATELVRQITPILSALQQHESGIAHGTLTADRIVVTPDGQLVLVEHVLASAVEALRLPPERLRRQLGIAGTDDGDNSCLDQRADVIQLGLLAVSLLLGRRIDASDYPSKSAALLEDCARTGLEGPPVPPRLLVWLEHALQVGSGAFENASVANDALDEILNDQEPRAIERRRALYVVPPVDEVPEAPAPLPVLTPAPDLIASEPRPRRRLAVLRWIAAGVAVLAIGEAFVISGLLRRKAPPPVAPISSKPAPPAPPAPQPSAPIAATTDKPINAIALPPVAATGKLEISSDPSGAKVSVDGKSRGTTPLSIVVSAGAHTVVLGDGNATATRTVTVASNGTATLMASLTPSSAVAGWVTIKSPVELQVREAGSLLGITSADRIMMPAGHHDLELSNASMGVSVSLPVEVPANKAVLANVSLPMGSLSINALPWANVLLDGQPLNGTTPFANIEVSLGQHEITWRHPQLGERRQTVMVTAKAPLRLVMDFSKK